MHLKLNNFKIWRSTGHVSLAPLTLLFGTNSSGKSSLIQSLLLLRQTVKGNEAGLDLNLGNPDTDDGVQMGRFRDLLCRQAADTESIKARQVGIEFGWRRLEDGPSEGLFTARYDEGTGGSADLEFLRIGHREQSFTAQRVGHGAYKLQAGHARRPTGRSRDFKPIRSFAFSPAAIKALGNDAAEVLSAGPAVLEELGRITYLGPIRRMAQRDYAWSGRMPGSIGDDGRRAAEVLIASWVARAEARKRGLPAPEEGRIFEGVERYLRAMGLADTLQIERLGNSARYELLVVKDGSASNLRDVGVGVAQVLPIVVAAFFAAPGHTVIVEEPESHLHPLAQAQLAELLVQVSHERRVQFVVETHSEHLLRRMQTLVAKEKALPAQLAMYFVERRGTSAELTRLQVDEFGTLKNWPEHFFGDATGETREQARARAERMRRTAHA